MIPESDVPHYRALSPYNVVHLTRPGTDYEGAGRTFERWLDERILEPDPRSMYVHEVSFDGGVRRDLIAGLRLQPYSDKVVLPHERTHRGPKEDRLALLRATRVSLEPLWFLYEGGATGIPEVLERVASRAPAISFAGPENTDHRLWVISDPAIHATVHATLEHLPVLIADGHHRYETALAYAEEVGGDPDAASRFTLALLTDLADPGLVALPLEGEVALVELHEQVIDNILGKRDPEDFLLYTRDAAQAVRWVDEGVGTAAFFLDAPDLHQVLKLAREGKTLPQKATYFHPKPPSGMVFDRLERDRRL